MKLDDLIADTRTSLTNSINTVIDSAGFRNDIKHLSQYGFWTQTGNKPHLWDHQRAAIGTVVAYWNVQNKSLPERPDHKEAALLKLPTGTGKSGIIAVVSRCLPKIRKILVLTPREALTKQLLRDLRFRFWGHLGYEVDEGKLFTADKASFGADLEDVYVETLLPCKSPSITTYLESSDRVVLVGTHQALAKIRKTALDPEAGNASHCAVLLEAIENLFDLVIVDEGHYEPAVSWSRGVRDFNLPTILLSATPYRNDYKSFRVRGRYLFNYPYAEAIADKIIRPAEIVVPSDEVGTGAVEQFVKMLKADLPDRLSQTERWFSEEETVPKVMVRADDLNTLEQLQTAIDKTFETESVLIHDRAKMGENKNRFRSVGAALSAKSDAQFWIHQFKLMEGIDDPAFVAVAIFDLMGNARQLVQQIGRVTRFSNGDKRRNQTAWVFSTPANVDRIHTSWTRYKAYEEYAANNTAFIVSNEVTLPDRLLEYMADYQYINGEFRSRFEVEAPLGAGDIQLPQSAAVLSTDEPIDDVAQLVETVEEAILDKDRFKVTPIDDMPAGSMGFSYYAWRNSPLLIDRFFSEWKLGIFLAVQQGNYVFMHDTEGLVIDLVRLGLRRADRTLLQKIFPEPEDGSSTRLSRLSFSSLEMSQQAIRSMAVRTRSFEDVFTDLLDPSLVPATAFGFVNGTARYVGFVRSRVREAAERYVPLDGYIEWTAKIAEELADGSRIRSNVFSRYAQVINKLDPEDAVPVSILLDFSRDAFIDAHEDQAAAAQMLENEEPDFEDLCAEIDPESSEFTIKINDTDLPCSVEYRESTGTYLVKSEKLNEMFPAKTTGNRRQRQTVVQRLNQDQSFRIIVKKDGVVYSEGQFYEPRIRWKEKDGSKPILDNITESSCLEKVTSEKGEKAYGKDKKAWYASSVFGLFSAVGEGKLAEGGIPEDDLTGAISDYPVWLCDDDNRETADFIGIDKDHKKIVFVHAKVGKMKAGGTGYSVMSLQEVGRQALASMAFISRSERSQFWSGTRWGANVQANNVKLKGRNRIFRNELGVSAAELNNLLSRVCQNPSFNKEIWMVCGKTVRRDALNTGLDINPHPNRLRQFLMHWDALQTACARGSVRLRLFCD